MDMVFEVLGMEKIERNSLELYQFWDQPYKGRLGYCGFPWHPWHCKDLWISMALAKPGRFLRFFFSRTSRMQPKLDVVIVCFLHVRQTRSYREDAPCLCVNFISLYYIAISVRRYADIMYDMVTSKNSFRRWNA